MRITEKQLRRLIRETALRSVMLESSPSISLLPPGSRVSIEKMMSRAPTSRRERASYTPSVSGWEVKITNPDGSVAGFIRAGRRGSNQLGSLAKDDCLGAYEISEVESFTRGLGPLLYDIAAELAGDSGITSDRFSVSPSARRVWDFYANKRPDVEIKQLPADCNMTAASEGGDWQSSSLSKVVIKRSRSILDELESEEILDFV